MTGKKKKYLKAGLIFSTIIVVICSVILLFWFVTQTLFPKNDHFILRKVVVSSPGTGKGWWTGKSQRVISILGLKPGKSNLFSLKLPELRKKLEKEPSIHSVSVSRVLPDILFIEVSERIPRAELGKKSRWVLDSNSCVMSKDSCLNLSAELPVIVGFKPTSQIRAGVEVPKLKPALELIHLTETEFPEFKIFAISVKKAGRIIFVMRYKNDSKALYKVKIPLENVEYKLGILRDAIIEAKKRREPRTVINLMFKDVVFERF